MQLPTTIKELWAAFSGGHDSLVCTHYMSQHPLFKGVLHVDTGIGVPETQDFVVKTCEQFGWPLKIYRATENTKSDGTPDPKIYEELVHKFGFPGAAMHKIFYIYLKKRQINRFVNDYKHRESKSPTIALATGVRKSESARRNKTVRMKAKNGVNRHLLFLTPIADFTEDDCTRYIKQHKLPRNLVKDNLCMSGECLCGAFAKQNELLQLEVFYPEVAARIRKLEQEVKDKFPWGWEEQPPKWWKDKKDFDRREAQGQLNLFCHSCSNR